MTPAVATPVRPALASPARHLPPRVAFYLQASMVLGFLAGSSAPTPLYALYRVQWGFSPTMLTVVFGIYAISVLASLLVMGRLSDYIGRRPVLMGAALAQAASMAVFAIASNTNDLMLARVIQGLSAGAALGAIGAGMIDIDKQRAPAANSVAPMIGTAIGGLIAGLMAQYLPAPLQLVYIVLGIVFLLQAVGVWFIAETATPRAGAMASLKPQFNLPAPVRRPLLLALPVLVAAWSLGGFYASLSPTLIRSLTGSTSSVLASVGLFLLFGGGAVAVTQSWTPHKLMRVGTSTLLIGLGVTFASLWLHSIVLLLVGTVIAGTGVGAGFQGGLRTVVVAAPPLERAGVLSVVFVVCYLGLGVPAIVAGYHLTRQGDIFSTANAMGAAIALLSSLAWLGSRHPRLPKPPID